MSWVNEKHPNHEGFVIGLVSRHSSGEAFELWRELQYPADDKQIDTVPRLQAGCSCGWRGPRWTPRRASYAPFTVETHTVDEERARVEWRNHIVEDHIAALRHDRRVVDDCRTCCWLVMLPSPTVAGAKETRCGADEDRRRPPATWTPPAWCMLRRGPVLVELSSRVGSPA